MTNEEQNKLLELVNSLSNEQSKLLLISILIMKFDSNLSAMEIVINHAKETFGEVSA